MIAFKVSVNGDRVCTVGVGWDGVLTAGVMRPPHFGPRLQASGLEVATNEHLEWTVPKIKVGDKICIEIIEADSVDEPSRREVVQERKPR